MDRLKSEAFFWKREDRDDGTEWIEPTMGDAADLARWKL
jgi:molybdopterin synthase catalytic subunit